MLSQGKIPSNTAAVGNKPQGTFKPAPSPAYSWRGRTWSDETGHHQRGKLFSCLCHITRCLNLWNDFEAQACQHYGTCITVLRCCLRNFWCSLLGCRPKCPCRGTLSMQLHHQLALPACVKTQNFTNFLANSKCSLSLKQATSRVRTIQTSQMHLKQTLLVTVSCETSRMLQVVLAMMQPGPIMKPGKGERTSLERQNGRPEREPKRAGEKAKGSWTRQGSEVGKVGRRPKKDGRISKTVSCLQGVS